MSTTSKTMSSKLQPRRQDYVDLNFAGNTTPQTTFSLRRLFQAALLVLTTLMAPGCHQPELATQPSPSPSPSISEAEKSPQLSEPLMRRFKEMTALYDQFAREQKDKKLFPFHSGIGGGTDKEGSAAVFGDMRISWETPGQLSITGFKEDKKFSEKINTETRVILTTNFKNQQEAYQESETVIKEFIREVEELVLPKLKSPKAPE